MKDTLQIHFHDEISFGISIQEKIAPDSPNWENSFIAELARENCLEMSEIDCTPIGG